MTDRAAELEAWIAATDRALDALQDWRGRLTRWGRGGLVSRADLRAGLELCECAGLSEFLEWGAELDLDALADALDGGPGDPNGGGYG